MRPRPAVDPFCRLARCFALAAFMASAAWPPPAASAAGAKRVVIVSWDGAADWVVDRLLAEGKLPNLARLGKNGVRADYCTPAFPSKTACGHAALWTGAYGDVNGITGNTVPVLPRAEHTLLETRSGFLATSMQAEPLFVTAAKAGKKVLVLSATQSFPPDPWLERLRAAGTPPDRFVSFDGFESQIAPEKVWTGAELAPAGAGAMLPPHNGEAKTFAFSIGDAAFSAYAYDDPTDPIRGFDTLLVRQAGSGTAATLKPAPAADHTHRFSPRFAVGSRDKDRGELFGYAYFRLFDLDPATGRMTLYQRAVNGLRGASTPEERRAYLDAYGGFHSAPFEPYRLGELGKTLWQNGDGEAERRLLETIRLDCEFLKRGTRFGIQRYRPDLVFHYTPMSDGAGHAWMGILDPESPTYDPQVAAKIWPFYAQVFQLQDEWLGEIIDAAGRDAAVCVVSDHGMAGVARTFSPNAVFEAAGLLARTADGKGIDLSRTKVCAPPWGDYFVAVNGADWKGGVVPAAEREAVLRQASDALLAARDPETGRPIVTRVFRSGEVVGIGLGGVSGGDLYLDLAPGYVPTSRLQTGPVVPVAFPIGQGVHGFFPLRAKMQAVCFLGGAGVTKDRQIAGMRQIDVAPTLARLLGVPAPADAQGHVIGEALGK